jgi:uncharacterized membrane protein YoaK (UPF0700 family)
MKVLGPHPNLLEPDTGTSLGAPDLLQRDPEKCRSGKWLFYQSSLTYLTSSVRDDALIEAELLILAVATGIQDAATYPDYLCFASNQTGNTVLLAVSAAGLHRDMTLISSVPNTVMSLSMFVLGAFVFGQVGNYFGRRRRWWLLVTNLIQTAMVFAATAVQYRYPINIYDRYSLIVIALLAFSSGGQVAMARSLDITEITTAMATAAYVDLFIDLNILKWGNRRRNRRVLFLIMLFGGAFAGAFAYKRLGSAFTLLMSAVGKAIVLGAFFFNKPMRVEGGNGCV